MTAEQQQPITIFSSYAQADVALYDLLTTHLAPLKRDGIITESTILAGSDRQTIDATIAAANLVLLLISPDYLADNDCTHELRQAMERQRNGIAHVVPILLRPADWKNTFDHL